MSTGSGESRVVAGRYRLDSHLGSGGMGTVWRGDERLRRHVAIKEMTIAPGLPESESEQLRERYLREARATARLRHPAVVGEDMLNEVPPVVGGAGCWPSTTSARRWRTSIQRATTSAGTP